MARSDIVLDGMLEKWTNPISRWQPRYFVLDQRGILSYYLSRDHAQYAVSHRWAVDVATTTLVGNIPNEPLRFDIEFLSPDLSPGKVYLRAYSLYDRHAWIRGLLTAKRNAEQNQTPHDRFKSFVSVSLSRPLETGGKNRTTSSAYVPTKAVSTSVIENLASRVETICGRLGTGIGVIEEGLAGADSLRLSIMLADVARNCQDLFEVLSELERNSFTSSLFGRSLLSIERFKTSSAIGEDPSSHPSKPPPSSTHSQRQDHQPATPAPKTSPKHASSPLLAENMNDASGIQSETSSLSHYDMAPED